MDALSWPRNAMAFTDEDSVCPTGQDWPMIPDFRVSSREVATQPGEYSPLIQMFLDQEPSSDGSYGLEKTGDSGSNQDGGKSQGKTAQSGGLVQRVGRQPPPVRKQYRSTDFRWLPEIHERFVLICMAIGVRRVTPKQIQMVLCSSASRESIGSHLQKYRLKLVKQNGLHSMSQLSNQHFPTDLGGDKLSYLKKLWQNPEFQGLEHSDVLKLLEQ